MVDGPQFELWKLRVCMLIPTQAVDFSPSGGNIKGVNYLATPITLYLETSNPQILWR